MTDEVDRHFQAAKRLAKAQAASMWLKTQYENLARQTQVWDALGRVLVTPMSEGLHAHDEAARLQLHCARVIVATCEGIMRRSGLVGLDHSDEGDQATTAGEDAREETLPW